MLRYAILGLICYREMSGYDILKRFEDSLKGLVYAQKSQVYLELKHLSADGLIGMRREEQTVRPSKNIYFATEAGRHALREWLLDMDESIHFRQRLPFLVKVYFSADIPQDELLDSLRRFRDLAMESRKEVTREWDHIKNLHRQDAHYPYWDMCADYCAETCEAYIRWADRCIAKLNAGDALSDTAP